MLSKIKTVVFVKLLIKLPTAIQNFWQFHEAKNCLCEAGGCLLNLIYSTLVSTNSREVVPRMDIPKARLDTL